MNATLPHLHASRPMPALICLCLLLSACCTTPTAPPIPASLQSRPVAECKPKTYREALACGLIWRTGWREAEADKAAARDTITPKE